MIVSAVAVLALLAPSAAADTDFTLVWSSGEVSRDASRSETTWKLTGTTLTLDTKQTGHVRPKDDTHKAIEVSAESVKTLADRLADVDAAAKKLKGKDEPQQGRFTSVSYRHGNRAIELYFPYWLEDEVHRPKNENKAKLEAVEALDKLRGKLYDIAG